MNEYRIKWEISSTGLFKKSFEGADIVEAENASEAVRKWKENNSSTMDGLSYEGYFARMIDIQKL